MPELWKDVVGYEGCYEVSDCGGVRSVPRIVYRTRYGKECPIRVQGRSVRQHPNDTGHLTVYLYRNSAGRGGSKALLVHRLVLEAFVGPCPDGMEACHFPDRNPANNQLDNLRWDTRQANIEDQSKHGTFARGENNGRARLKEKDIPYIYSKRTKVRGVMSAVAREFDVPASAIRSIWIGETWRHITKALDT